MQTAAPALINPATMGSHVPDAVKAKLKAKSDEFESFYIYQFIELMQPKDTGSLINGGPGEEIFRHKLSEQMATNISKQGGFGLSNMVYTELLQQQEAHNLQQANTGE